MSNATAGYRQYARDVSRRFFGLAVILPLGAGLVAMGSGDIAAINLVHVATGAIWAGATLYLVGVLSPTLMGLEPPDRAQVTVPLIPKHILFYTAIGLTALLTGAALAGAMGLDHSAPLVVAAYLVGLALLVAGGYLVYLQGQIYREVHGQAPDMNRVGALAASLGKAGMVAAVLQVVTLVVMAVLRFA